MKRNLSLEDPKQAIYPLPPRCYTIYTDENLQLHQERIRIESEGQVEATEILPLDPPNPIGQDEQYSVFGMQLTTKLTLPNLEDANVEKLYSKDLNVEIKNLLASALLKFVDILDTLALDPLSSGPPTNDLNTIMLNLMHIIGQFRSHQSLETIKLMQQNQIEQTRQKTKQIKQLILKFKQVFQKKQPCSDQFLQNL